MLPWKLWVVAAIVGPALTGVETCALPIFNDVPPSDPFYNDVNAIQGAGITQGCGGGNFCPSDPITREAEAAFALGRASRRARAYLAVVASSRGLRERDGRCTRHSSGGPGQ